MACADDDNVVLSEECLEARDGRFCWGSVIIGDVVRRAIYILRIYPTTGLCRERNALDRYRKFLRRAPRWYRRALYRCGNDARRGRVAPYRYHNPRSSLPGLQ